MSASGHALSRVGQTSFPEIQSDENFEERTLKKHAQGHIVSDCPNLDSAWVFFTQKFLPSAVQASAVPQITAVETSKDGSSVTSHDRC